MAKTSAATRSTDPSAFSTSRTPSGTAARKAPAWKSPRKRGLTAIAPMVARSAHDGFCPRADLVEPLEPADGLHALEQLPRLGQQRRGLVGPAGLDEPAPVVEEHGSKMPVPPEVAPQGERLPIFVGRRVLIPAGPGCVGANPRAGKLDRPRPLPFRPGFRERGEGSRQAGVPEIDRGRRGIGDVVLRVPE